VFVLQLLQNAICHFHKACVSQCARASLNTAQLQLPTGTLRLLPLHCGVIWGAELAAPLLARVSTGFDGLQFVHAPLHKQLKPSIHLPAPGAAVPPRQHQAGKLQQQVYPLTKTLAATSVGCISAELQQVTCDFTVAKSGLVGHKWG
jgi:hypothetical protein